MFNLQKQLSHFGTILFRFAIVGTIFSIGLLFSQVLVVLIVILLIMVAMLTLFTLFLNESFRNLFNVTVSFGEFFNEAQKFFPMLMGISLALMIAALILQIPNYKEQGFRNKMILYGVFIVGAGILFAVSMIGGYVHV